MRSLMSAVRGFVSLSLLSIAGCNSSGPTTMQRDVVSDTATADIFDAPPLDPALFNPCTADTDCPSGGTCLTNVTGFPGGLCSQSCLADSDCVTDRSFVSAQCVSVAGQATMMCLRECLNGFDCGRDGYTCIRNADSDSTGLCRPSCSPTNCGAGARCNEWTSQCMSASLAYPPGGGDNGAPCTVSGSSSECRSQICDTEFDAQGHSTGWAHGSCESACSLPNGFTSADLYALSDTFPQANCPLGSICFPHVIHRGPGDLATCLRGCTVDSDCRASEGYYCHRTFQLPRLTTNDAGVHMSYTEPKTFANGFCDRVDCGNDDAHHDCPSGYHCQSLYSYSSNGLLTNGECFSNAPPDVRIVDASTD